MKLPRDFYNRSTLDVARELLGKVLVHERNGVRTSGAIVEVEAYIGECDPACHAAPGPTVRNAPLYGPPGYAYVYLNYGVHCLVNVVTEPEGAPAAVLIRALDPLDGIPTMRRRRMRLAKGRRPRELSRLAAHDLCRGPGNLTMAMGISLRENRLDLTGKRLFIEDIRTRGSGAGPWGPRERTARGGLGGEAPQIGIDPIQWGPRIGIRVGTDRPWRAWLKGHPAVSGTA